MLRFFLKRSPAWIGIAALSAASLACTMGTSNAQPTAVAQESSVIFIAPDNNSVIAEGSTITFAVNATNSGGVSKVDFMVDDTQIGTQTAPTIGQTSFTARQTWTAAGVQGHFIAAAAFGPDGKTFGDAKIALTVVSASQNGDVSTTPATGAQTTSTPTTAGSVNTPGPTIIVITNTAPPSTSPAASSGPTLLVKNPNLNIRSGDSIKFPIIGAMKTGDIANIIGRNAARTWWFIQKDQAQGWVIGDPQYSTVQGDTSKVPLVQSPPTPIATVTTAVAQQAPTSTTGPFADLMPDSFTLNPSTPSANNTFTAIIVIRNLGSVDAPGSFLAGVFGNEQEHSNTAIPAIPAGQSVTVNLPVTLHNSGANQSATITLDFNNNINEGPNGKANNSRTINFNVN